MRIFELTLDMLIELEALREAVATCPATREHYRRAYEGTALRAHDASGPTGGAAKIIERFYPEEATTEDGELRNWREALLMRRLGLSPEGIEAWKENAREAEMFT